ncbi:formate/nitrite transporter family protein [Fulvimarina endophytica]|uniref:Formate/nitrite transporter family protein n=1 Tax=Fulvimarina endophytica TaxID=2293836 RepID=A0A371X7U9_9HYPH|nr:formate/nitrite transporter family protein [Fulvimarina endophytica]RFC65286.1 formate/nitrite transporter family protein [Fulvimarina endophytica]
MSKADPTGADIAEKAPLILKKKALGETANMAVLAIAAGAFIAFGSIGSFVAEASGGGPVLGGLVFSVGLILVMVAGTQLFTGNTMMVLPDLEGRLNTSLVLYGWVTVWLGNLVGSLAIVVLFIAAGGGDALDGAVGQAAVDTASSKAAKGSWAIIASAILANMLVCLAVWMSMATKSVAGRILAIIGPITIFVASGFEHSIANMSILPIGWAMGDGAFSVLDMTHNILLATVGNIIGGILVALVLSGGHGTIERVDE